MIVIRLERSKVLMGYLFMVNRISKSKLFTFLGVVKNEYLPYKKYMKNLNNFK